jgi:hypothetical protein
VVVATIATNQGNVNLATVTKIEFVPGGSFPGTKKAVLDGAASADALAEINKVRAVIGSGDGSTGWIQLVTTGPGGANDDTYVRLAQVDEVVRPTPGSGGKILLKSGGVTLGEPAAAALAAINAKFPPPSDH